MDNDIKKLKSWHTDILAEKLLNPSLSYINIGQKLDMNSTRIKQTITWCIDELLRDKFAREYIESKLCK